MDSKENKCVFFNKSGAKKGLLDTVKSRKLVYHKETGELPGESNNAKNNARCTLASKTTHGLDGQHQYVNRTLRGRVIHNGREQK